MLVINAELVGDVKVIAVGGDKVLLKLFSLAILVDLYSRLAIDELGINSRIASVGCVGRVPHGCLS